MNADPRLAALPPDDFPCRLFVELVTEYLDGALPPDVAARAEEHAALCAGCRSALDQIRAVVRVAGTLRESDVAALDPDARAELLAVFQAARAG